MPEQHHSDTALHLLSDKVPVIREHQTIGDIEQLLLHHTKSFDTIYYIYVVDETHRLLGVLSVKEVFRARKNTLAKTLMHHNPVSVRTDTDQEKAVYLALKHNIKAIPVVDDENKIKGVILFKNLLEIVAPHLGK